MRKGQLAEQTGKQGLGQHHESRCQGSFEHLPEGICINRFCLFFLNLCHKIQESVSQDRVPVGLVWVRARDAH